MPLNLAGRALAALLLLAAFQFRPPSQRGTQPTTTSEAYGDPNDVELAAIAYPTDSKVREHVRTRGRLEMVGAAAFVLSDGGNRVLVLFGHGLDAGDMRSLLGGRVLARGIVRAIRKKEYVNGVDLDLIEDPMLPVLPAPDAHLPPVSLTVLGISDDEPPGTPRSKAVAGMIRQILAAPDGFVGKSITVVGSFRGRNLFDDLPRVTRREKDDWVLKDGDHAAWIQGKPPRGSGFALDLDSKTDTARRLEVTGKATVVDGVVYIRATRVQIAVRNPKTPER